jgi:CubicO group peptidase (beta-lactamase class C family)
MGTFLDLPEEYFTVGAKSTQLLPAGAFFRRVMALNMKKARVILLCVCLVSSVISTDSGARLAPRPQELGARIQRIEKGLIPNPGIVVKGQAPSTASILERMKQYRVPGVSIAVINSYEVEWEEGYGVVESGETVPVTPDTLFQAASISKPVAAAAALYYVERGILGLDEDVNSRLRSWKIPENAWTRKEKVTLRELLSHTAGLTVSGFPGYAEGKELPSLKQILDGVKPANTPPIKVDIEIGSRFRYAGGGYTVLQQLLIDVLGRPFPYIVRDAVLIKLDMSQSTYEQPLPKALSGLAATGHRPDGSVLPGKWHTYPEMAAAGLWTTPTDLALFAREIMLAEEGKSDRILSQVMVELMLTPVKESVGLGLFVRGTGQDFQFSHSGGNEGFRCHMMAYPERGQGAVIMTNSDLGGDLMSEILRSLSAEYGWPDFKPVEKEAVAVAASELEALAGIYQFTPVDRIKITVGNGCLFADPVFVPPDGKASCVFFPDSVLSFFSTETDVTLTFTKDAADKVVRLTWRRGENKRQARKI